MKNRFIAFCLCIVMTMGVLLPRPQIAYANVGVAVTVYEVVGALAAMMGVTFASTSDLFGFVDGFSMTDEQAYTKLSNLPVVGGVVSLFSVGIDVLSSLWNYSRSSEAASGALISPYTWGEPVGLDEAFSYFTKERGLVTEKYSLHYNSYGKMFYKLFRYNYTTLAWEGVTQTLADYPQAVLEPYFIIGFHAPSSTSSTGSVYDYCYEFNGSEYVGRHSRSSYFTVVGAYSSSISESYTGTLENVLGNAEVEDSPMVSIPSVGVLGGGLTWEDFYKDYVTDWDYTREWGGTIPDVDVPDVEVPQVENPDLSGVVGGINSLGDLLSSILSFLKSLPALIANAVIGDGGLDFDGFKNINITSKFPFCIPFDLANILLSLAGSANSPRAPKIEIDLTDTIMADVGVIVFDFSSFEPAAKVVRYFTLLAFVIGLILITRNLIRG